MHQEILTKEQKRLLQLVRLFNDDFGLGFKKNKFYKFYENFLYKYKEWNMSNIVILRMFHDIVFVKKDRKM